VRSGSTAWHGFLYETHVGRVSRQNLIRVENGAIRLVPRIENRAWTRSRVALRTEDRRIVAGREILRNHGRNNNSPPQDRVYLDPRTNHTNSLLLDFPGVQSVIPLGAYRMMFSHESFEIFNFHFLSYSYIRLGPRRISLSIL